MLWLDRQVYAIRARFPWIYDLMAAANACLTVALYGRRISRALKLATITGTVDEQAALMRPIGVADLDALDAMLKGIPEEHLKFFHPHGFDRASLRHVLKSKATLTYGLLIHDRLVAYALVKLFATRKAYIGRLVAPNVTGLGIGKFLIRYMYWQGRQLGFALRATVHQDDLAGRKSYQPVRPFDILADLPGGYKLLQYSILDEHTQPPELCIVRRRQRP